MLDAALIKECADPFVKPAIVEQFVRAAGSADPLTVTVKSGGRMILVPKPASVEDAMAIVRQYAGHAVVRVGLTQLPAGVGVTKPADLKPDLVDACQNLRIGTAMFAKVLRIVAKWYGNPTGEDVFQQMFEDAVYAWKTGEFEGVSIFHAEDPGRAITTQKKPQAADTAEAATVDAEAPMQTEVESLDEKKIGAAEMRVDLSRIGAQP
ncbi:conjugal transfer protein TraH [Agrobacterium sp. DSM 25558]|uniref:TraH family protein n=1 Tax=Agrobacterium sp. DSM 25558 TaxID=1907665 RepID=UPI0009725CFF|nr:TraH family protein [Agrobacterium sp. DSM 25558]SCX21210.1 conjugal transfer protein TraH [Agrobacterium sp. DSM 25558]